MTGTFITLEGSEGVGKSTALTFIQQYYTNKNRSYVLTREPGGTSLGEKIREVLLMHQLEPVLPETELLLLFAARAEHIGRVIKPALAEGKIVISDRFTDSSFAYQGFGRGLSLDKINFLSDWIQGDVVPTRTLLLDAPVEVGFFRLQSRNHKDRIESEKIEFFERVRQGYLSQAKQYPERFSVIDATQPLEKVQQRIEEILNEL